MATSAVLKPTLKVDAAHSDSIWSVCWCKDSLVTGSLDGSVKLWNCNRNNSTISMQSASASDKFGVNSVTSTSDGSTILAAYQNGDIGFFQTTSNGNGNVLQESAPRLNAGILEAWTLSLSPNDDVFASGAQNGSLSLWSMQDTHEKLVTLQTNKPKLILSSDFSIDARIVCSSMDGTAYLFDVATQKMVHQLDCHALPCRSVAFSPDGRLVYTASDDRLVSVCDTVSGNIINSFSHRGMVFAVDSAPDHRHFISGCADNSVCLWDLGMQRKVQSFEQHTNQVWDVAFQKSESSTAAVQKNVVASVGNDGLLQLYE